MTPAPHQPVAELFLQACPDYARRLEEPNAAWAMRDENQFGFLQLLASHLVQALAAGRTDCLPAVFGVVERLLAVGDDALRFRLLIALLRELQTRLIVAQLDPNAFAPWLGLWGRTFWAQLDVQFVPLDAANVARMYSAHRTKYAGPPNEPVIGYLEAQASPSRAKPGTFGDAGGFELHTHPDLDERLREVAAGVPKSAFDSLFGCPILAAAGIIFALARGVTFLAFRLPADDLILAQEFGAEQVPDLGGDWVSVDPWQSRAPARQGRGDLAYWCEQAYRHALALGGESAS